MRSPTLTARGRLLAAIKAGDEAAVERLVQRNPGLVGTTDDRGEPALCVASSLGWALVVEILIAHGADVEARNRFFGRNSALYHALKGSHLAVAKALVRAGCDPSAELMSFTYRGAGDVVSALIKLGADVNARDKQGRTPLHEAALDRSDAADVAEVLIAAGADVNAKDGEGHTPLYNAAWMQRPDTTGALIRNGADPDEMLRAREDMLRRYGRVIGPG